MIYLASVAVIRRLYLNKVVDVEILKRLNKKNAETMGCIPVDFIIAVVVAAIIIYMIVRNRIKDKEKQSDIDSLKAEIEALKAEKSRGENSETAEAENARNDK